jgi:hypothetical protein
MHEMGSGGRDGGDGCDLSECSPTWLRGLRLILSDTRLSMAMILFLLVALVILYIVLNKCVNVQRAS